jgi:hypothetical protein
MNDARMLGNLCEKKRNVSESLEHALEQFRSAGVNADHLPIVDCNVLVPVLSQQFCFVSMIPPSVSLRHGAWYMILLLPGRLCLVLHTITISYRQKAMKSQRNLQGTPWITQQSNRSSRS